MFSNSKNVISIDLKGMIASGGRAPLNIDNLHGLFGKINKMKFDALSIVINSPGGSPVQSSLIGQKIREISEKKNIKCYCFVEDVAASGGYWLACSADEIYADVNSIIGSIGVISGGFGFTELIKKIGVERRIFTAGENKSFLDPFLKVNKKDEIKLKDLQKKIHQNFINWVSSRRGKKIKEKDFKQIFSKLTEYGCDLWAVMEWECCIKSPEQGAKEGAEFIKNHINKCKLVYIFELLNLV
mgnify:CR=1 FL=1